MTDIFISYSRHDQQWVTKFAKALEDVGYSVWWDTRLLAGDDFHHTIPAALEDAKCVIVVWSTISVTRKWVRAESYRAYERDVLVPVQIEPVQVPLPFNLLQAENMQGWNGKTGDVRFQRLMRSVDRYCRGEVVEEEVAEKPPQDDGVVVPAQKRPVLWKAVSLAVGAFGVVVLAGVVSTYVLNRRPPVPDPPMPLVSSNSESAPEQQEPLLSAAVETKLPAEPTAAGSQVPEPEMVSIPAGSFTMGCVPGRDDVEGGCYDNEKPAHTVQVNGFQIGKYELTFDEYDACTAAGVCPRADDQGWGRGRRPVINVSWNDIQTYIKWLNAKTGKEYRLPTEAEWEYAARAGGDSAFPWGKQISCEDANYGGLSKECNTDRTQPVGSYAPNRFGLYDTAGNVYEWVSDEYGAYSPVEPRNPGLRVVRGGSWYLNGRNCRSANRLRFSPDERFNRLGCRLVLRSAELK